MGFYDGVAFWIERHGAARRPVSRVTRPARRVEFASPEIQGMSGSQHRMIVPCVSLGRADVTNSAVTMIDVVALREASRPGAGLIELGKALGGEFRPLLGGTKQRFCVGVVVAHARPGVRGFDAQPVEHRQHGRRLERRTVVAMQHGLVSQGGNALGQRSVAHQVHRMVGVIDIMNFPAHDFAAVRIQVLRPNEC